MSAPGLPSAPSGERIVRRLLLLVFGLNFVLLAAVAIYVFRKAPRIDYSATNRLADLTYLETWLGLMALGCLACLWRRGLALSFCLFLLLAAEAGAQFYVFCTSHSLYQPEPLPSQQKFEPHPLLVGIPKPGNFAGLVHDAQHHRRTDNQGKVANPRAIFALGGSTTYDLANTDLATWESDLSRLLGPDFMVENLGVPGYTSVENLIQTLFSFRDAPPACALYFEGLNDLRNAHVEGLKVDYSDFHLPSQPGNLGLTYPGFLPNNFLSLRILLSLLNDRAQGPKGAPSSQMDQRLAEIFGENMKLISIVGQYFGVKVIFVPSVANWSVLTGDGIVGWFPFVRARDMHPLVDATNDILKRVASETGAVYLDAPLAQNWTTSDFRDIDHFTAAGAQKFAVSIAPRIAELCR